MFRTFTAVAILALTAAAAQAGSATVQFGDLNPASQADAKILSARVQSAAQTVCAEEWSSTGQAGLFYKQLADSCADRLSRSTMKQIEAMVGQRDQVASK